MSLSKIGCRFVPGRVTGTLLIEGMTKYRGSKAL